jgi:hypothetical protein
VSEPESVWVPTYVIREGFSGFGDVTGMITGFFSDGSKGTLDVVFIDQRGTELTRVLRSDLHLYWQDSDFIVPEINGVPVWRYRV